MAYVPDADEWNKLPEQTRNQVLSLVTVVSNVIAQECVPAEKFVEVVVPLEGLRMCIETGVEMGFAPTTTKEIIDATDLARSLVKDVVKSKIVNAS
jgi:hypothetical protein